MNSGPRISYISQFFILLGLVAAAFVFGGLIALVLWQSMVGGNPLEIEKAMLNPANANAVKIVQLVVSLVMFLVPAFVFARIVNKQPLRHLGLRTKFNWIQAGLIALIVFMGFYLSGALSQLTNYIPLSAKLELKFKRWEKEYTDQVMVLANMKTAGDYIYTLLVIAFVPAVFEEVLFRGALQQLFVKWTRVPWLGILITAILFSLVHRSFYGFLSRAALGIVLGYMFYYSKSLWLNILAHFLNNGVAVTVMYMMSRKGKLNEAAATMDEKFPIWWGIIASAVIIALFVAYKNESKRIGTYYLDNTATEDDNPFSGQPTTVS